MQQMSALVTETQSAVLTVKNGAGSCFQIYPCKFTQLNSTASSSIETICKNKWRLQEEAIKVESMYAADVGQPMDNFIISDSHLKDLKSDDQRVRRLELKIQTLQILIDLRKSRQHLEATLQCSSKLVTLGQLSSSLPKQLMDAPVQRTDGCTGDATVDHLDG